MNVKNKVKRYEGMDLETKKRDESIAVRRLGCDKISPGPSSGRDPPSIIEKDDRKGIHEKDDTRGSLQRFWEKSLEVEGQINGRRNKGI